ncbi:germination specific N-acetylmuramoyl-L-alanine amidase [Fictibacillus macauensis ZFHKF-1]|uniref:Germination specific N-acetylmuramoyl-L-alanine amidase n=1 Tax=Fictibacillus macauensis ZFHKF-1 TaxID=1196324 RepID=I8AEL4_9BACL|nr:N-acetylmuramoyl-L-alanine amidase CwlD [Fictibacillus macauensis]EIT84017.1 germination specific N-acetylmuramoyl-L-alanine amidase [Fictibacillus macauensis ZFHKF-1]
MRRRGKQLAFVSGFVLLLFLFSYQFTEQHVIKTWNLPLSGKVIILDPGHGGMDGGAVGKGGVLEKDITLDISLKLRDYLQEAGALVIMTRERDKDLGDPSVEKVRKRKMQDLRKRKEIINGSHGDLYVSVHLNALPASQWRGAQVFFHPSDKQGATASKFIQAELKRNLENTNRVAKSIDGIYLLRTSKLPGTLVEVGFLSNPSERELLKTKTYQMKISASIYQGILRYYTNEKVPKDGAGQ